MLSNRELRREHVLDQAIAAGKFGESRRAFWSEQYDRDPAGTEQTLASLASVLTPDSPYPRELFPELSRRRSPRARAAAVATAPTPAPGLPAPGARGTDNVEAQVAAWSRQLFPETAAAGAGTARITRAND